MGAACSQELIQSLSDPKFRKILGKREKTELWRSSLLQQIKSHPLVASLRDLCYVQCPSSHSGQSSGHQGTAHDHKYLYPCDLEFTVQANAHVADHSLPAGMVTRTKQSESDGLRWAQCIGHDGLPYHSNHSWVPTAFSVITCYNVGIITIIGWITRNLSIFLAHQLTACVVIWLLLQMVV